ncbi:MAG: LacI family DNA-binding transcriptional regulator [Melioribacteraceae bacterium]|nr:LacI family DNA-binding transcriptional regulator [Melioribacteraceae bacterium]
MFPTIKDVAKKANVSTATVSHVVNNKGRISPETTKKVLKTIKELNYHPSRSARGLVSQKTGNIGFIVTNNHFLKTEAFYTRIFLGVEFEAHKNEYYVLLTTIGSDFKKGDALPRFILEQSTDGIIIAGKIPELLLETLCQYNIPLVILDYIPKYFECSSVLIDNVRGGFLATKHLIDYGHKNIAFISGEISHSSITGRLRGYKQALKEAKIKINNNLIETNDEYLSRQNGYDAAEKLFKKNKNITAIFSGNDTIAIGAMQYLKDNNYNIPEDISLVGFDDVETDLLLDPPLTTIQVPKIDLGIEGLQLLVNIINSENKMIKKIIVPVEIKLRESTKSKL